MRPFTARAPSEPPKQKTRSARSAAATGAAAWSSLSRNARRIGLPVMITRRGAKKARVSSKARNTARTNRPRILLASPGIEFCSRMAVGTRDSQAASTSGPEA